MRYRLISFLLLGVFLGPHSLWSDGADLAKIGLTESEIEWISNIDTIRVGGPLAFPPFHYYEEGRAQGIGSEYVRVLADRRVAVGVEGVRLEPFRQRSVSLSYARPAGGARAGAGGDDLWAGGHAVVTAGERLVEQANGNSGSAAQYDRRPGRAACYACRQSA